MSKTRKFPCPYCKGQGEWVEPVLDYGEGPRYQCGFCKGDGMIEIDGPLHQIIKDFNEDERKRDGTD